ncbi:methionine adenosyltransferase [Candidatus Borrarchaeum sp.]|uniref:methionine adenosyltransferase n=1 Tax=Candidatus Borrarchaeum sp. TaxID=2846742 RepID=UPI0025805D9B|nr:methionine adenosyltransferase [Candidatus Borrarchaeum sp.]
MAKFPEVLDVTYANSLPVSKIPTEIVERKGAGHPDVLCDKASEELSIKLSEWYLDTFGAIMHHNVDKCVLSGGQSNARFGGGEVIEPMYLLLVGRAVGIVGGDRASQVPIGKLAVRHTKRWLADTLPHLDVDGDIIIDYKIRSGSTDLVGNFEEGVDVPRSNDTSIGVGYAPFTDLERLTYESEMLLNSRKVKYRFPEIGEDIKVMGVRRNDKIQLTVANAIISSVCPDADHYMSVKDDIKELVLRQSADITDKEVIVKVNTADDPSAGIYYLTCTGTSAEHGDDGQVGRGNRSNGLITPKRPMTLEAAAGKNPISHVGKTYNVAARRICNKIVDELTEVTDASCCIVSEIGCPITEPQVLEVELHAGNSSPEINSTVASIAEEVMNELPTIWRGFLNRQYELY